MLGKLFKHEMKAMGRIMLPLYAVMLFAAALFAFNMRLNMSGTMKVIVDRFAIITGFLFGAAVLAVFVVMVIIVIQRFYKNLLGTEGYLMFTLPAKTHEHILSKAISAFLWIVIGAVAGVLAGFLMISITSNLSEFINEVQYVWEQLAPDRTLGPILWFAAMLASGIFETLIKVYAAIAVGHQVSAHRLAGSVLAYICFGVIEMLLSLALSRTGWVQTGLFVSIGPGGSVAGVRSMQLAIVVALIGICVYGTLCWYLLDRKLNLE